MKKRDTFFIGLMLFSMFFGAGNLIFPPVLGAQSGSSFWPAITGFILTGVGLPFAVLLAVSLVKGGAQTIGNRVHPIFSTIFMIIIYLSIGPFLAIPRNANVAYEMGIKPYLGANASGQSLFLFTLIFFVLVFVISLNPSYMEKYMGRWITPVLLVSMVALCTTGLISFHSQPGAPQGGYENGAFFKGFLEGYNTMDALASLAFGIVILTAVSQKGVSSRKQLTSYTLKAALVAGSLLALVYVTLGLMGARMPAGDFESGTDLLSAASVSLFGSSGTALLGVIFTLACFTTVVGLTTACGQYFSRLLPKAGYKVIVLAVTLIGLTLSNMGLSQILKVSVPFLVMAYPLTIVLVALTFFSKYFNNSRKVYATAILFTGVFALLDGLGQFGINLGSAGAFNKSLPLASSGLQWVLPAILGALIGLLLEKGMPGGKDAGEEDVKRRVS
ncbi:branched-chain amino acid transport system II carrier protein [Peribacillus sp. SCS-26]|uniref:branched-chain amino acid transport system II carrier protein n=1 Tax=Paraperibacillus marinus TaxID=3115295 RepID=UPI003905A717